MEYNKLTLGLLTKLNRIIVKLIVITELVLILMGIELTLLQVPCFTGDVTVFKNTRCHKKKHL